MDLDELRDALDEVGRRTAVDPMAARAEVGARRSRLQRRRRSVALVSIAAVTALVVGTIALASTRGHNRVDVNPAGVPSSVPSPPTTTRTSPSTTMKWTDTDPLPAGSAMLEVAEGTISVVDAHGKALEQLVSVDNGLVVTNAQLTADHGTIFYAVRAADGSSSCPSILKWDLKTDIRTIVGNADDFAVTPDGRTLVLVFPRSNASIVNNCQSVPLPFGVSIYEAAFLERDLTTGAQWTLPVDDYHGAGTGGPHGHPFIDAATNVLISANCDAAGCTTSEYSLPQHAQDAIVYTGAGPACGCETLVAGADGVYGVYGVEAGGVAGIPSPQTSVRRYTPDRLDGAGTVVAESNDVELSSSVAPTTAGVFVIGYPANNPGYRVPRLYRVENGGLQIVDSRNAQQIFAIPPFTGG